MGIMNTQTKEFMSVNARFADLFNNVIYEGKEVIQAERLERQDATEVLVARNGKKRKELEKFRDILKKTIIMTDQQSYYILLGIENQTEYHLAMPVKIMLYDAIRYSSQIQELAAEHNRQEEITGKKKNKSSSEFLSGLYKEDKLLPVVTLTLYWSNEEWNAPRKLSEMLDIQDEKMLPFLQDYDINLVEPGKIEDFENFKTDLGGLLEVIKFSDDKEKLIELLYSKAVFQNMDIDAANLLTACTGIEISVQEEEGKVRVCKAVEEMKKDAKLEGRIESILALIKDGLEDVARKTLQATEEEIEQAKALM